MGGRLAVTWDNLKGPSNSYDKDSVEALRSSSSSLVGGVGSASSGSGRGTTSPVALFGTEGKKSGRENQSMQSRARFQTPKLSSPKHSTFSDPSYMKRRMQGGETVSSQDSTDCINGT